MQSLDFMPQVNANDVAEVRKIVQGFERCNCLPPRIGQLIKLSAQKNHIEILDILVNAYPDLARYEKAGKDEGFLVVQAFVNAYMAGNHIIAEKLQPLAAQCDHRDLELFCSPHILEALSKGAPRRRSDRGPQAPYPGG